MGDERSTALSKWLTGCGDTVARLLYDACEGRVCVANNMLRIKRGLRVVFFLCYVQGCAAYNLSSPLLTPAPRGGQSTFQNLVLGIGPPLDKSQTYELGRFVEDLRKMKLFKAVDYSDRLERPDLVLSSFSLKETDPYQACPMGFVGQILTVGSAGLIPQICNSTHEVSFDLYSPQDDLKKTTFSFTYQTRTILGWAALFYVPSADWSAQPSKDERANLLKSVFLHEAADIQKMLP